MGHLNPSPIGPSTPSQNIDDEIIPTAIVIKNIPFNVKRETLLDIIVRALLWSSFSCGLIRFFRHLYPSPPLMRSTTTLTNRAHSVV
jgi:hypothetical protein